jgi:hypothetical protein
MENKLVFNEETHQYFLESDFEQKELISVTTLLKKHGLSPNYAKISKNVLSASAERGKIIHEELSNYILRREIGFTAELQQFIDICSTENFKPLKSEFMVYNDEIAGTVDMSGIHNDKTFLADFKTTATLHLEAISWQLSLYEYLIGENFDELLAFHFTNGGLEIVPIERIDRAEIEKLLECERNGTIYKKQELQLQSEQKDLLLKIQCDLQLLDEQKKALENQQDKIKQQIMRAMEQSNIKSYENDYFKMTYVEANTRETIDSTRLKKEMPEIAGKFLKISNVSPSLRITLKEKRNEQG